MLDNLERIFGIYRPEDYFPEVDAIVISAYEVVPIREKLEKKKI